MFGELWVNDVIELVAEGDCFRLVLQSGERKIKLRFSRHTLVKSNQIGKIVLDRTSARIVELRAATH